MKKEYQKPKIKKTKLKMNFFYSDSRYLDSLDMLQTSHLLSQSSDCVDTCFMPDTNILMADGSTKEIQHIQYLDEVISYNLVAKEQHANKVEKVIEKTYINGYLLINDTLKITLNHKVWVFSKDWIRAEELEVGDTLLNPHGEAVSVEKIEHIKGTFKVYNLHIEGKEHNFFAEEVLVHNHEEFDCS